MNEPPSSKRLILVVEDDDVIRDLIVDMLRDEVDFDVVGAASGTDVLKLLPERTPHLVLMDLAMPGMDGVELAEWFRAEAAYREIPLIGMTALGARAGTRAEALAAGCAVVLDKPLEMSTVVRTIRSVLA